MSFINSFRFGAALTLALQASTTSSASTVTCPTVAAGDLIVLWDGATNSSGFPASVLPTGFTSIFDTTAGLNERGRLSYKVATGSESGSTITGMSGTLASRKAIYVFRGTPALSTITVNDATFEGTANDPAIQTCNASGAASATVVIGVYKSSGTITTRTFTVGGSDVKDGEITPALTFYMAYKIYNSSPQDVTIDMADFGNNILGSCYFTAP